MAKKRSKDFHIKSGTSKSPEPVTVPAGGKSKDLKCGVNFRYFQQNHECLSAWQKTEIKALANWIVKQASSTAAEIQSTTKNCHAHIGKRKALPRDVSPDVRLYGLDVTKKARVHGFFTENTFYLVWLDRNHTFHE